jgi:hypothetical protein
LGAVSRQSGPAATSRAACQAQHQFRGLAGPSTGTGRWLPWHHLTQQVVMLQHLAIMSLIVARMCPYSAERQGAESSLHLLLVNQLLCMQTTIAAALTPR